MCYFFRNDYYHDNLDLSVFQRGYVEYSVPELVSVLLGEVCEGKLCKAQPVSVKNICSFVVDLNCVPDLNDLTADNCGLWEYQGLQKTWVVVNDAKNILLQIREHPPKQDIPLYGHLYIIFRVYNALQAPEDFKQMIVTLQGGYN